MAERKEKQGLRNVQALPNIRRDKVSKKGAGAAGGSREFNTYTKVHPDKNVTDLEGWEFPIARKVFDFVQDIKDDIFKDSGIKEEDVDYMTDAPEEPYMTEEIPFSKRLETIDPYDKDAIKKLQTQIGMSEDDIDGVYGPMTERYLKSYILDMNETFSDAARFNLGLNEFSESPAALAYQQHLKELEAMRQERNRELGVGQTPDPTVAPIPNYVPGEDPEVQRIPTEVPPNRVAPVPSIPKDIQLRDGGGSIHELWPEGMTEEEMDIQREINRMQAERRREIQG